MLPCFEMMQSHALLQPFILNHCCKLAIVGDPKPFKVEGHPTLRPQLSLGAQMRGATGMVSPLEVPYNDGSSTSSITNKSSNSNRQQQ